jgi:crotonobetainyl-CoA:carnitine CoA-transferase CaiB-like acyl-CoA transferase
VQRHRFATRDELVSLLADRLGAVTTPDAVVDLLAEMGAPVDALVKITVDESAD